MRSLARAAGISSALAAGFAVVVAATGWLYLVRGLELPGPPVGDALPLDELAKRAAVPLLLYALIWTVAGLLLGLIARAAGADRLTAGLLLALGVGLWTYLATGASLLIIRQVPAHDAFHAAWRLRAVFVAAAVAGLTGALTGRARSATRSRARLVLPWAVAATGLVGVLDAILPARPHTLLVQLTPERVHPIAGALVGPLGLALLLAARGLARGRRQAWLLAVALLAGITVLHVLHSFDYGAIGAMLVAIALVACRQEFKTPPDPEAAPRLLVRGLLLLAAVLAYGVVAVWVNRVTADRPFTFAFALRETLDGLAGLELPGSKHFDPSFGEWFPLSIFLAGLASAGYLLHAWLAPWRYRLRQEAREREVAHALVAAWGVDTLAPFVLRADKTYFFDEDERAFLAYKVVGGVAIVSGDPVGPREALGDLVARFVAFAHERDWRIAILGASERFLELYAAQGLHALYHGDEAVLDTVGFSLEGRAIRKVRQSLHRLEKVGYRAEILHPRQIGAPLRGELENIARSWRGDEPNRGFVMALDALFRLEGDDAVFVVGRGPDGAPEGFLHFAVSRPGAALSLSSMPRLRSTPNGFNEWLVCEAVAWAREHGFAEISLNFAPFAALLAPEADLSRLQRVERRALLSLKGHFQLDNLLLFNSKFFPRWQPRFVVYERRRDLPRVGIAALAAEAYLPFTGRERR